MNKKISKKELQKQRTKDVLSAGISNLPVGIGTAWDLAEAYFGAGLKLRQERATEWVEMVRDNPGKFVEELANTEEFQDKFVYCLEKYLRERSEEKRRIFRNIFLGEMEPSTDKVFSVEKYINTLQLMSEREVRILRDLVKEKDLHKLNKVDKNTFGDVWVDARLEHEEIIYSLVNLGILNPSYKTVTRVGESKSNLNIHITKFGLEFIKYITNEN